MFKVCWNSLIDLILKQWMNKVMLSRAAIQDSFHCVWRHVSWNIYIVSSFCYHSKWLLTLKIICTKFGWNRSISLGADVEYCGIMWPFLTNSIVYDVISPDVCVVCGFYPNSDCCLIIRNNCTKFCCNRCISLERGSH